MNTTSAVNRARPLARPVNTSMTRPMTRPGSQQGAVLIISLILLLAMTLLGVASINSSSVSLKIVGNLQSQKNAEETVLEGIEIVLGSAANFTSAGQGINSVTTSTGENVTIEWVRCRSSEPAQGYSASMALVPEDNTWQVRGNYRNNEGAWSTVEQGVRMRQLAGSCP